MRASATAVEATPRGHPEGGIAGWSVPAVAVALFAAAFSVAVTFVFAFPMPSIENDAREYLAIALNLSKGIGFSVDGAKPTAYRPPVFSFLLGGWFSITGTSSLLSVGVFQSLIHASGVVVSFLLFLELRVRYLWAFWAGLFLAITPLLITRVAFVLQEPTVMLFTTLAMLASVRLIGAPSRSNAVLTGLAWGVCTLSKVSSWFAPFLLLVMSFLPRAARLDWRSSQRMLLLLCFAGVIASWTLRNYVELQRFIPVNNQAVLEWNVQQAEVPGQPSGDEIVKKIRRLHPESADRRAAMWRYVTEHPRYFLFDRTLRNVIYFAAPSRDWWVATGRVEIGKRGAIYWLLVSIFHLPLYALLLYRSWQMITSKLEAGLIFGLVFYWLYWAEHVLLWGDPRYGLAVYPLLLALALPKRFAT